MSGHPTSFPFSSIPYTFLLLFVLSTIPQCLSTPGSFNFTGPDAFIEIDTQPLSCSTENQSLFSLKFDVLPVSNSSVLFTGISGSLLPGDWSKDLSAEGVNPLGAQGDPLALFVYIKRPYFNVMIMRLTDYQVQFYLHHAFGYFDRSWNDWHKVELVLSRRGKSRVEVTFKVDQKSNNGILTPGNMLWPDWFTLRVFASMEVESKRRFYFNEAFLGLPSDGSMSHYAIDSLMKYVDAIRTLYAKTDISDSSFGKFTPFRGTIKSFLLSSDCACGISNYFGPKMIQVGSGVKMFSVCDVSSLPPLASKLPGSCSSKIPGISCGCSVYSSEPVCYCPPELHCGAMKKQDPIIKRVGLLKSEITDGNGNNESHLMFINVSKSSPFFLNENPITYNLMDSCFANIFLCEKPIIYELWMYIDPLTLIKGSPLVIKHASSLNSPWYMQITYNGYLTRLSDTKHIMKLSAEIQAPPNYIWSIDGCESNLRAPPGQWHQVKVHWDKKTLSLYVDGNLCGTSELMTSLINATFKQRFSTRRTPFIFLGNHTVEDLFFNNAEILPNFTHLNTLSNNLVKLESAVSSITEDFYASFQLNGSMDFPFIQLPGINITVCEEDAKLAVENKATKECQVFQLPRHCENSAVCNLDVERHGSEVTLYSQNERLSRVFEVGLCDVAKEYRMREEVTQTSGLVPNTQIQLFNRRRSELINRRLIHTSNFPTLNCGFDYIHSVSKHKPLDLIGVCEPSTTYSRVQVEAIDSFPKSSVKGALMVSRNSLLLLLESTSPEALCLRDLELCRYGMTMSFWILVLPVTKSFASWPILQQASLSGSQLTVVLFRNNSQYFLDVSVKSLHTITGGKATSTLWKINSQVENLDENWMLVTISWSHIAGLSVKLNDTLVASDRQPTEIVSYWEAPIQKGVWFGHRRNPDTPDGVVIDDFKFLPAELNYLDHVGQKINVTLSNQGLEQCKQDTCRADSSCYPILREIDSLGDFCRCDQPRRVCRELPVGTVAVTTNTSSVIAITATPAMIELTTTTTELVGISEQTTLPHTATTSTRRSIITTTAPKTTASTPRIEKVPQTTSIQSRQFQDGLLRPGVLSRDFIPTGFKDSEVHSLPQCDPPCQNGGRCVESNGHFSCDCSATSFWGKTCTREHIGWLSRTDGVFRIKPHRSAFATYPTLHGDSKQRLTFKTPISVIIPDKLVKRSVSATQTSEYMILLSVESEIGTLGFVTINSDLYILIHGTKKSRTQLLPCPQSHGLIMDDSLPHVLQLEQRGALLRAKVDGIKVYPKRVIPPSCDKWLFFSPVPHINNRTYEETTVPQSRGFSPNKAKAVLGAWPSGEGEFKGAIGGWMIDGEEMIGPVTNALEDSPNTVYQLNRRFHLSNGDFYWIRLNSLTPVTVISDTPHVNKPTNSTVPLWLWIVGCISMGLLLLFFCCLACIRVCRQQKGESKASMRRNYSAFQPMIAKTSVDSSHLMNKLQYYPTQANENFLTPEPRRLRAHSLTTKYRSPGSMKSHWRAKVLTLQSYHPIRRGSEIGTAPTKKHSTGSVYSYRERDDFEKILLTPDGDSVITLSTNHGISVKQWNTYDGSCKGEILSRPQHFTQNGNSGLLVLQKSENLLFTDDHNFAQLYPLRSQRPTASIQLPSTVWGAFPFGELFLFVSAPMPGYERDSFASLHFWSPSNKSIMLQSKLKAKHQWRTKGFLHHGAKNLSPLLSPNYTNLLLRCICSGPTDAFFSMAINLALIFKLLHGVRKPIIVLDSHILTSLVKHDFNLEKTLFLADDIAVTGDELGALHIWNVHSGENYRSVQSDPIPFDGPLLINPGQYDFSQIKMDSEAEPITALSATEPSPTETGTFTWFCSGDDSGCVVVRRCVVSSNGSFKNVASRIHAKFRPYSRTIRTYSADKVTCARLLNRSSWRINKPEAFLATGDSSGCIRVWLLPQCTQLAHLSASCESGLLDLELTQSSPSLTLPGQWLQVVGLVRRDKTRGAGFEYGRVVIIHLSANEENGVPNAMHSPRFRLVNRR